MNINLKDAQRAAVRCCGENAPDLSMLTKDNVISFRSAFFNNVQYNGKRSHNDIIIVLNYMTPIVYQEED